LYDRVLYPSYASVPRPFNVSPLDDQAFAGAMMWVFGTFVYLVPAVTIAIQILSPLGTHRKVQARGTLSKGTVPPSNTAETSKA
jgi:cytochrome c oxidase assembly factor CtaG